MQSVAWPLMSNAPSSTQRQTLNYQSIKQLYLVQHKHLHLFLNTCCHRQPSAPCIAAPLTLAMEQQTTDLDYNVVTPTVLFADQLLRRTRELHYQPTDRRCRAAPRMPPWSRHVSRPSRITSSCVLRSDPRDVKPRLGPGSLLTGPVDL